jgi:hypothetical protein
MNSRTLLLTTYTGVCLNMSDFFGMPNTKKFRTEEQWSVKLDLCTFLFPTLYVLVVLITDPPSRNLLVKIVSILAYSWSGSFQINILSYSCSLERSTSYLGTSFFLP